MSDANAGLTYSGHVLDLALQAYVWGYPAVAMERTKNLLTMAGNPIGVAPNTFFHGDRLMTPKMREVVKPNNDTLYSSAWLDLRNGPLRLDVPDMAGRYYSLMFMDAYTNAWSYVGRRTTGTAAGSYVVVGPDWTGDLPDLTVLRAPTSTVWLLGRTLLDGEDDLPTASALIHRYSLTPLVESDPAPRYTGPFRSPQNLGTVGIEFFDEMCAVWAQNPPPAQDEAYLATFAELGLAPGRTPSVETVNPVVRITLEQAGAVGDALLAGIMTTRLAALGAGGDHGWSLSLGIGSYGQNYLLRGIVCQQGIGALHPEEALYASGRTDSSGEKLDGKREYVLHFPAGQLPPVDSFWSVTAYDQDLFLIENPAERYSIGDRTPGLTLNADGSLDIWLQATEPAAGPANWLPVGDGPFELTLRCYQPRPELLDGTYTLPPVVRLGV